MLINLRNALMAGKRKPTAKDYVCDLAMWDAIENAGWGVHDPSATTWKDLTGNGHDIRLVADRYSWASDSIILNGTGTAGNYESIYSTMTVEVVMAPTSKNAPFFVSANAVDRILSCKDSKVAFTGQRFGAIQGVAGTRSSFVAVYLTQPGTAGGWNGYLNSAIANLSSQGDTWRTYTPILGGTGNYYSNISISSIRCHSRALTADEIAANYAIDKARFGLP